LSPSSVGWMGTDSVILAIGGSGDFSALAAQLQREFCLMGRPRKKPLPPPQIGGETGIVLDSDLVEGFVRTFLWERFDSPKVTPWFHKELWQLCCASSQYVDVAAPRGHAKSTAGTLSFTLAAALFGFRDFIMIVSATEKQAVDHLQDIRVQLTENEDLIETFQVHGLSKDNEAEIICHVGNRVFKIVGKGAEQKLRGIKWRNKRPNLVMIDDIEEDEQVMNPDRREKLMHWFTNALLPAGSDECLFRVFGTILHLDSLLQNLQKDPMWLSRTYRAHASFDDFSSILWPEKFPESRLRMLRDMFARKGNSSGYSQEYLNLPVADTDRYFRPEWFLGMDEEDRRAPKRFYSAIDLAIDEKARSDRTAIVTFGVMSDERIAIMDVRAGRWDALEIIDQMFEVHADFEPEIFVVEGGHIQKALGPFLNAEMNRRGEYLNIETKTPTKDKRARARSLQGRMRAGGVVVDTEAPWYQDYYNEMTTFPRGDHDDRVDASAWCGLILDEVSPSATDEEMAEAEMEFEEIMANFNTGRCPVTGY